jgi:H+-transporting ATPase
MLAAGGFGYTLYRIAMTLAIMVFIVLATIAYGFFSLSAVMIIMLALLDDVPIMTIAFDNAAVPPRPVRWQMDRVLIISSVLGGLAVAESFGLLYISHTRLHLAFGQLQTFLFLQLVVSGHLLLFITRSKGLFWRPPYPGKYLFWAIMGTQAFAALLCGFGLLVPTLSWSLIGLVWVYNLAWMLVLEIAKLAVYRELDRRAAGGTTFISRLKMPLSDAAVLAGKGQPRRS